MRDPRGPLALCGGLLVLSLATSQPVLIAAALAGGGWWLRYAALVQGLRDGIDARIRASLGGDGRAIATALLTARRAGSPVVVSMMIWWDCRSDCQCLRSWSTTSLE